MARQRLDTVLGELAAGASPPSSSTTPGLPIGPFRGQIEPPVPGEIAVAFGIPRPTEFGTTIASSGIELTATPGEPVYAVHDGDVVSVGAFEGLGTLVIVSHGDQAFSLYGYLSSIAVHEGVRIDAGAELGTAGVSPTGNPRRLLRAPDRRSSGRSGRMAEALAPTLGGIWSRLSR